MKITINNRQRLVHPETGILRRLSQWLLTKAANRTSYSKLTGTITLILTDDKGMGELNRAVFGKTFSTDVICCHYDPIPGEASENIDADLAVNVEIAMQRARRNWPMEKELALYIAHACDHLFGADDATPEDAARMRRRELRWLREWERRQPYD